MVIYKFTNWFREFGWRHLVGLIFVTISLYPILYVITNSFADFANLQNSKLIPDTFTTKHYESLTGDPLIPYFKWLFNTYKIAGIAGFLNVLLGTFAAYAFARLKFKGRRVGLITLVLVKLINLIIKNEIKKDALKEWFNQTIVGFEKGALNMVAVGIAIATAGIIVGAVGSTGLSTNLIIVIESIAKDNVTILLFLTIILCLLLGMGLPTTANYVVVASLMATVLVDVEMLQVLFFH